MSRSGRVGNCMPTRCSRVRGRGDARHRSLATVWRVIRQTHTPPPQPGRQPQRQLGATHRRAGPIVALRRNTCLHRPTHRRRTITTRDLEVPRTSPRPPIPPPPRPGSHPRLDVGASGFPSPETRVRERVVACLVRTTKPATSQGRLRPGRWCGRSCVPRSCWSGSGCCGQGWLGGSFGEIGDAGGGDVAAFGGDQFVVDLDATWGTEERLTQEFG